MTVGRRFARGAGMLLVGTMVLTACSGSPSTETGPGTGQGAAGKSARIYVITPQTGADAALGLGVRNSVQLAVDQAMARGDLPGWNLEVVAIDDTSDEAKAAEAAKKAAADEQTVAVIGSIYSGLTKSIQPVLASHGILHVSPTATNPTLTKGEAFDRAAKRPYGSFFRMIAPDDAHAPAVAKFLTEKGVQRVSTVNDGGAYGVGFTAAFAKAFAAEKGKVVSGRKLDPEAPAVYPTLVKGLLADKPQAVVFGGNDPQGGPLAGQLREAGMRGPMVGGDALNTEQYVPKAGPIAAGDISTMAGKPLTDVEAGKRYLADYRAGGFAESATSYGPLAYDAANAVLASLKSALPDASDAASARKAAVAGMPSVTFDGTSGKVAFDQYGDITPRVVTVNVLSKGTWNPAKTYTFD